MQFIQSALSNHVIKGAIGGAIAAAVVDLHAFNKFTNWTDLKSYSWGTAAFRWLQGAVAGAAVAAGFGV